MKLSLGFFLLPILLLMTACGGLSKGNEQFEQQYGSELEKMRAARDMMKAQSQQVEPSAPVPAAPSDWRDKMASDNSRAGAAAMQRDDAFYAYEDKSGLDPKKSTEIYSPSGETYNISRKSPNSLPEDMFQITYNTEIHPPFIRIGGEFDAIKIPESDFYQVKTEPTNKAYLLLDAAAIQHSINKVNADRTTKDIANSEILINEIKQLKREQKMIKVTSDVTAKKKSSKDGFNYKDEKEAVVVYKTAGAKKSNNIFSSFASKKSVKN